ncbi:MAG: hypothetical protein WA971_13780 [Microbacterium sp.]
MTRVHFIDTTIRDGQGSLWATSMRTAHMLPALEVLDRAGFDSIEFLAFGSRFKKFVRHLRENPWDWIRMGAARAENTPLRWHGSIDTERMSGVIPPEIGELLVQKVVDLGITQTRTGNNWNNFDGMPAELKRYDRLGMTPVISLMYSVSPRHDDEYYVRKAVQLASMNPYRICLKDVSGLLTPDRIRELVPRLLAATEGVTWEFHGHCNNGLGPLNAIECVKAGIRYIHTAVPPLSDGASQPSVYTLASNLRVLGYEVDVDDSILGPVTDHLTEVARREGFPTGAPAEFDLRLYEHQIPGGMISNLRHQLRLAGIEDRLEEVLAETPRVRADFGYPIMVTPLSQFVASQATLNVVTGERYGSVTDATIEYALGRHGGQEAIELMDQNVRDKILDRPRAAELSVSDPRPPTIAELRDRFGHDVADEDLILMSIVGADTIDVVGRALDPRTHEFPRASAVVDLVSGVLGRTAGRSVSIHGRGFALTVDR